MWLLEPNAMVVHLVAHMDGHRDETGPLLSWIMDLALVLRVWGSRLDPYRIHELMPPGRPRGLFARILNLLSSELGQELPDSLADLAKNAIPLPLAQILRQRRVRPWGMPGPRGWARLAARKVGFSLKHEYPKLHPGDLVGTVGDTVRDWRSNRHWRLRKTEP